MKSVRKDNTSLVFFSVTFAFSWIIWFPFVILGSMGKLSSGGILDLLAKLSVIIAAFGPAIGAFFCIKKQKGNAELKKYIKSFCDFDIGWKAWIIPVVLFMGCTFLFFITSTTAIYSFSILNTTFLITGMTLLGGGQEEIGWRGFILDHLEKKSGIWFGNIILAFAWSVWHLPLFFIPEMGQYNMSFIAFTIFVFGLSGVMSWVRDISGKKIFAGMWAHGSANASLAVFPIFTNKTQLSDITIYAYAILVFIIGIVFLYIKKNTIKKMQ